MAYQSESGAFKPGRYAAIDIGTVTCRLLVADVNSEGTLSELHRDAVICNLGAGVDETHRLASESIERVGTAIERFNEKLGELSQPDGARISVKAVATSASRDAENAGEFKARLAEAGLDLQVIPGEREAALSFAGASSAFAGEKVVVVDIGGGSTEVIAGWAGSEPRFARSFNVGCRRVTERFLLADPPADAELNRAAAWIDFEFADYLATLCDEGCLDGRMVAVAGTATSVVSMREEMRVYDSARVHGTTVLRADVDGLLGRLAGMSCEERTHIVGLDPGRAPVIVAGLLILQRVMELSRADSFTVSECDILHGIVLDSATGRS